jgi:uncharacterized protein YndB with AHSA1/START domain/DNA-binding transcriptional ArsR family regulator
MADDATLVATFKALGDASRRRLLDSLAEEDGQTLIRLESRLPHLTRFGVMRHLRVLETAGLVTTRRVGREKHHYLDPVPIRRIYDRWMSRYADHVVGTMTALKQHLEDPLMAGPKHVYSIYIQASPDALWRAITDGDQTVRYFYGTRVASDWEAGSPVVYTYADGSIAADGEVISIDPPRELTMSFHARWDPAIEAEGPVRQTWQIEAGADGSCRLSVVTEGLVPGSKTEAEFTGGIVYIVSSLKTMLESGAALPVG